MRGHPGHAEPLSTAARHAGAARARALATIDIQSGTISDRRAVCGAPRGVAFDAASGLLHIACATGDLVSLPAAGGGLTRRLSLGVDLRVVVVQGGHLLVSRMKYAEFLELDATGALVRSETPPDFAGTTSEPEASPRPVHESATVAWRAVGLPGGGVAMHHTRGVTDTIQIGRRGYGGGSCGGAIVNGALSVLDGTSRVAADPIAQVALPVDLALSPDEQRLEVVNEIHAPVIGQISGGLDSVRIPYGWPEDEVLQ